MSLWRPWLLIRDGNIRQLALLKCRALAAISGRDALRLDSTWLLVWEAAVFLPAGAIMFASGPSASAENIIAKADPMKIRNTEPQANIVRCRSI